MNSAWNKNNIREIRHTLGRYIALLIIIALGVGFFSGLKITKEAMIQTGDTYIKDSNMYDYRLLSTLGFSKEDAVEIGSLKGVETTEAAVYADFITDYNDHTDIILKAHSITDKINQPSITEGRMPEADNECVADALVFTREDIGKKITISDKNPEDTIHSFAYREYTIVGLCNSANYMYRSDRGTTSLPGGSVMAFLYLPEKGFSLDYYNEIYVTAEDNDGVIFSKDYDKVIANMEQPLKTALEERAELRYEDIAEEANKKINEAKEEYDESYGKYLSEKSKVDAKLENSRKTLKDGKTEILRNEQKLSKGEEQLKEGQKRYNVSLRDYNTSKSKYEEKKQDALQALDIKQKELDTSREKVNTALKKIEDSRVIEKYHMLMETQTSLNKALAAIDDTDSMEYITCQAQLKEVEQGLNQIEATGVVGQYQKLNSTLAQLDEAQLKLDSSRKGAHLQLASAKKQLDGAKSQLDMAKQTIEKHRREAAEGRKALKGAKKEYRSGLEKYNKAKGKAEESLSEARKKLDDGKREIQEAREDINDLDKPVCYVLDRSKNIGYACFENDSSIVDGIAYYSDIQNDFYIHSYDLATGKDSILLQEKTMNTILFDDDIYYMSLSDNYGIKRVKKDGTNSETLVAERSATYNLSMDGEYLYYQVDDAKNNGIYMLNINTKEVHPIILGDFNHINITSNYVFFQEFHSNNVFYIPVGEEGKVSSFNPPVLK